MSGDDYATLPEPARALIGAEGKRMSLQFPDPLNPDGLPVAWRVTVKGEPFKRGFRTPGGGWSLWRGGDGDQPSWRVMVRLRGKRRLTRLRIDDLIHAEEGW